LGGLVAGDDLGAEAVEGTAKVVAFAQNGDPRQPGLEAVEDELFVERPVVIFRHTPFLVVIGDVERVGLRPSAALLAIGMGHGWHGATLTNCELIAASKSRAPAQQHCARVPGCVGRYAK